MQLCFFVLFLNGVMLWKGIVVNLRPSLPTLFWKRIASLFTLNLGPSPLGRRMCRRRRDRMRGMTFILSKYFMRSLYYEFAVYNKKLGPNCIRLCVFKICYSRTIE